MRAVHERLGTEGVAAAFLGGTEKIKEGTDYGVPLVKCSRCVVPGDLPSHGSYTKPFEISQGPKAEASPDQLVTRARLEAWLAEGADIQAELANAVLAADADRLPDQNACHRKATEKSKCR